MRKLAGILNSAEYHDRIAIIDTKYSPDSAVSYGELFQKVERLKNFFALKNFPTGTKVGIFLENSSDFVVVLLALFRSGLIAVPLSLKLSLNHLEKIAKDCEILICEEGLVKLLPGLLNVVLTKELFSEAEKCPLIEVENKLLGDEALVLYTSGSTGFPKGVIHTHSGLGWKIETSAKEIVESNLDLHFIHYLANPLYHMNGLSSLLVMLKAGLTILLAPTFNAESASRLIQKYKVATVVAVPSMISQVMAINENIKYSSVFWIKLGSAPVAERLFAKIENFFPRANIRNGYGLTEVGPNLFGEHPTLARPALSVGYPRSGIEYRIIDGVLQIKSPSIFKSYTLGATVDEKMTDDGFFITGDLFRRDENGFYFYQGRADDMIICGGDNIYLNSISLRLETHPAVANAVAVGLTDDIKGQKPYAFVVLKSKAQEHDLLEFLRPHMTLNALPRRIWFVEKLPVTELGKIARKTLEVMAENQILLLDESVRSSV